MLNVFLGIIIVVVFTACGYKFSLKYKERKEFFKDAYSFNELMISEVSFRKRTLPDIKNNRNFNSKFSSTLDIYIDKTDGDKTLNGLLSDEENDFLEGYFSMLGRSDSDTQKKLLESSKQTIKKYMDESGEQAKKYTSLCVKLSFLFGLIGFILIL